MSIVLNQLTKKYGEQVAVNAISIEASPGEVVGFLGPNGAGKSTTMKMITGYLQPDGGHAVVCGMDVVEQPISTKQKIGYLPESNPLYIEMYVREYLDFVASIYNIADRRQAVEDVITKVGLTAESHKKTGQLSKGYKQRVGLAAAIIHNPEVLILDEPTSGLDPNQIVEIREVIKTLGQAKTVLISTHIMQEVEAMCDRIIIINKGNIVANDSLANLKQTGAKKALKVGFEETLEPEWLTRLPGVKSVEKIDRQYWLIQTDDTDAARRQVLQLANEQQLNIVNLQTTGGNLEDIFRGLTGG